ncbi:hypothetical protein OFC63_34715, partial [Escherichia coli]|nr:hypothetical protein [Escherichia coli]
SVAQDAVIQRLGESGYEVRTPVLERQQTNRVQQAMQEALGAEVSVTSVSPSFGEQVRDQALQAVAASLLIIVFFITVRY